MFGNPVETDMTALQVLEPGARTACGVNLPDIKVIMAPAGKVERLREDLRFFASREA